MSLDPVVEEMCLSGYGDIIEILLLIVKSEKNLLKVPTLYI